MDLGFRGFRVEGFVLSPQNVYNYFVKQAAFEDQKDMASDDFEQL